MGKIIFAGLIWLAIFMPVAFAGSGDFNGIWLLTRDHKLDGRLDPSPKGDEVKLPIRMNSHHNKFSGEYVDTANDSIFNGETYTARNTTLILFFQYDQTFYAIHNGRQTAENHFAGTWYSAGNLSGDFELKKQQDEKL